MNSEEFFTLAIISGSIFGGIVILLFLYSLTKRSKPNDNIIREGSTNKQNRLGNTSITKAAQDSGFLSAIGEIVALSSAYGKNKEDYVQLANLKRQFQRDKEFDLYMFLESYQDFSDYNNISENLETIIETLSELSEADDDLKLLHNFYQKIGIANSIVISREIRSLADLNNELQNTQISENQNDIINSEILKKDYKITVEGILILLNFAAKIFNNTSISLEGRQLTDTHRTIRKSINKFEGHSEKGFLTTEKKIIIDCLKLALTKTEILLTAENRIKKTDFPISIEKRELYLEYSEEITVTLVLKNVWNSLISGVFYKISEVDKGFEIIEKARGKIRINEDFGPNSQKEIVLNLIPIQSKNNLIIKLELGYEESTLRETSTSIDVYVELTDFLINSSIRPYDPEPAGSRIRNFYGRETMINEVTRLVNYTNSGKLIGIFGLARIGKTSLIFELLERIAHRGKIIYVYFSLDELTNWGKSWEVNLINIWIEKILGSFHASGLHSATRLMNVFYEGKYKKGKRRDSKSMDHLNEELLFFEEILNDKNIQKDLDKAKKSVVLILDEYQRLEEFGTPETKHQKVQFIRTLKKIAVHTSKFTVILSGYHDFETLMDKDKYWSEALGKGYSVFKLGFLGKDHAEDLIREPMMQYGISYEPEVIEKIFYYTQGYPWYIHKICDRLWNLKTRILQDEDRLVVINNQISMKDLEKTINYLFKSSNETNTFTHIFAGEWVSSAMEAVVYAIAKVDPSKHSHGSLNVGGLKFIEKELIISQFLRYEKSIDRERLVSFAKKLEDKNVLRRKEHEDKTYYAISIPLLDRYLFLKGNLELKMGRIS